MNMKGRRNQAKERPEHDFCYFRLERKSSEKGFLLQNLIVIGILQTLEEQKSSDELIFDEK